MEEKKEITNNENIGNKGEVSNENNKNIFNFDELYEDVLSEDGKEYEGVNEGQKQEEKNNN